MRFLIESLYVAAGAAIGANGRYWIGFFTKASSQPFPWPTLLINVVGSALLGAFTAVALIRGLGWQHRLFFAVGICGGFTTFSTFSYEVIDQFYERGWRLSLAYVLCSLILSVLACFAGGHLARIALQHPSPEAAANPFRAKR